jgi:hypothetical protein
VFHRRGTRYDSFLAFQFRNSSLILTEQPGFTPHPRPRPATQAFTDPHRRPPYTAHHRVFLTRLNHDTHRYPWPARSVRVIAVGSGFRELTQCNCSMSVALFGMNASSRARLTRSSLSTSTT